MKQLRNGKRAAWNYRVMDVRKRLLSTKEAQETLASWVLSKPPKSIHNSIVTRCTLTISCITLALFYNIDFFSIGSRPAYMKSKSCDRSEVGIFSCAKSSWKLTSRFCVSLWRKNFIDTIWRTHFFLHGTSSFRSGNESFGFKKLFELVWTLIYVFHRIDEVVSRCCKLRKKGDWN